MERLKDVDEVAYVRFASVYRQFKDINTFMEELNKLLAEALLKESAPPGACVEEQGPYGDGLLLL